MIDPGKRLFRPGRGLAALAVSAMLIGGVAFAAAHGATSAHAQGPVAQATGTAAAGGPPPLPTLPPKTATPSGPPPLPTVPASATARPSATSAPATPAKTPVSTQAPKPVSQAPAPVAQKPAPAAVQLPNTGNGGVTGSDSSPLLPAAAGFGAIVLVAGGVYTLRSRKHED